MLYILPTLHKNILAIFLFLLTPCLVFSQLKGQGVIDSLNSVLSNSQNNADSRKADILENLGKSYLNIADYTNASSCFFQCLGIGEKTNQPKIIARAYRNIAIVYFHQQDIKKSEDADLKSLDIFRQLQDSSEISASLNSLAGNYLQLSLSQIEPETNRVKAEKYYEQALQLYKQMKNDYGEAYVYMNQSSLCFDDYQKKIELALKAKEIWDKQTVNNELPTVNIGNIGVAYLDIVRSDTAHKTKPSLLIPNSTNEKLALSEKYLMEAIQMASSRNDQENFAYFTGVLAELQAQKGDFKNAYTNFRKYQDITDSIFSQTNKNKIASLESQRAIDLKNKEIENKELQIGNQRKNMWLLLSLIGFLFAMGIIFYRQSMIRKRTNAKLMQLNMELAEANKVKAKFFGIISHDLRKPIANLANFLQLQKLKPGLFSEQQVVEREQKIKTATDALLETMEVTLLWSKGQMENFRPEITEFKVGKLYSYLQKFFTGTEQVSFRFTGDENIILKSDEHYLRTIMQNLTANAIKALLQNPAAAIEWKAWQDGEKIFLSIADNGTGASIEKLKALYDESAGMGGGNGLGLHIIRDLAKAIHCSVEMDASYRNGTRFLLSFASNKNNMA
jgi:signal transduction histidine kinase